VPTSVSQRLRNLARELLTQYAVERLLYRIGRSSRSDRFVLKGAMLFRAWTGSLHRPTQDFDLLHLSRTRAFEATSLSRALVATSNGRA